MSKIQRMVVLLATLATLGMGLMPPWYFSYHSTNRARIWWETQGGYAPIWKPPHTSRYAARIDVHRFCVQMATLLVVTTGLYFVTGNRRSGSHGPSATPKDDNGDEEGGTGGISVTDTAKPVVPRTYMVLGTLLSVFLVGGGLWVVTTYPAYIMLALLILVTWAAWQVEG